ncbi:UNVERIFIED_CONTAM: putative mitochondrial protein [Sesamum latifolium]|uniref:Mitochondrial protein n=1 Tax=Sesamum latifolium TaxID=2727402 RepID=A0AAW2TKC6_9LAMI
MNEELLRLYTSEEIVHALKQMHPLKSPGPDGKMGHASMELDVSKAYDRVEWCSLEIVMLRLGFHPSFVSLIMTCAITVSFSYLLNEVFSNLIRQAEEEGRLKGITVSRQTPRVSHLLFADDTLIFYQATTEAFNCVYHILTKFECASGLKINLQKSAVVFSKNMENASRIALASILGIFVAVKHEKYLGLPTVVGRSKREVFNGIKECIWKKLNYWSPKQLSQVGRPMLGVRC